jgi:hypothetical protein
MLVRPRPLRALATSVAVAVAVLGTPAGLAAGADGPTRPAAAASERAVPAAVVAGEVGPDAARKKRTRSPKRRTKRAVALPAPAASASAYAFSTVLDGKAVRWDPCAPIRWTANTSRGPAGGLALLQESVDRIAQLTGTTWVYVGPSSDTPTSAYLPSAAQDEYAPVLLGWTDAGRSDLLAGQPRDVLGMTRTAWFGIKRSDGTKIAAIRTAAVALDRTDSLPLRGRGSWKALVLHELGHVMGLAHVEDRSQLMAAVLPASAELQAGDVAGLSRVGRGAGCVVIR